MGGKLRCYIEREFPTELATSLCGIDIPMAGSQVLMRVVTEVQIMFFQSTWSEIL
jgi:hypothetical protein